MNNQEAIKYLKHLSTVNVCKTYNVYKTYRDVIYYAIKQLEKAEVWDEPVEMEVTDPNTEGWVKRSIVGRWGDLYVAKNTSVDCFVTWKQARPIKKEPLDFKDWCKEKSYIGIYTFISNAPKYVKEYEQYCDNFKKNQ